MSEQAAEAVRRWRRFATSVYVNWNGDRRTWAEHIPGAGYGDEKRVIQPIVFPEFAEAIFGFGPLDLAAENSTTVDDSRTAHCG